jgi:hypothetical protein
MLASTRARATAFLALGGVGIFAVIAALPSVQAAEAQCSFVSCSAPLPLPPPPPAASRIVRADDQTAEGIVVLDDDGDDIAKRLWIPPGYLDGITSAKLWVLGQGKDCSAGGSGRPETFSVNSSAVASFSPCETWGEAPRWVALSVPVRWLHEDEFNTFGIGESDYAWTPLADNLITFRAGAGYGIGEEFGVNSMVDYFHEGPCDGLDHKSTDDYYTYCPASILGSELMWFLELDSPITSPAPPRAPPVPSTCVNIDGTNSNACLPPGCVNNDDFRCAMPVPVGSTAQVSTDWNEVIKYSHEPGEPLSYGSMDSTAWFSIKVTTGQWVALDTWKSDFDTVLCVYRGSWASPVMCDGSWTHSFYSQNAFYASPGSTYYVQVGGRGGQTGYYLALTAS